MKLSPMPSKEGGAREEGNGMSLSEGNRLRVHTYVNDVRREGEGGVSQFLTKGKEVA